MTTLQIILIALIVFLIVGILIFVVMNMGSNKQQKNIELIRGNSGSDNTVNEKDLQNKRRAEIARKLKASKDENKKDDPSRVSIAMKLQQAGSNMPVSKFWLLSFISGVLWIGFANYLELKIIPTILFFIIEFKRIKEFVPEQKIPFTFLSNKLFFIKKLTKDYK